MIATLFDGLPPEEDLFDFLDNFVSTPPIHHGTSIPFWSTTKALLQGQRLESLVSRTLVKLNKDDEEIQRDALIYHMGMEQAEKVMETFK